MTATALNGTSTNGATAVRLHAAGVPPQRKPARVPAPARDGDGQDVATAPSAPEELAVAVALLRHQAAALDALARSVGDLEERVRDMQRRAAQVDGPAEDDYEAAVARLRLVGGWLPPGALPLVISRGDERLLELGRPAWHFPRAEDGGWPGWYPATSQAAIAHLESLRARGATHLLVPADAMWWLDHYEELARYLHGRFPTVFRDDATGVLFALEPRLVPPGAPRDLDAVVAELLAETGAEPAVLDWTEGRRVAAVPSAVVFTPPTDEEVLPYLDGTVDVVAVSSAARLPEARRVARFAVVEVADQERVAHYTRPSGAGARALPSTSIVIPTYNAAQHVQTCLRALRETLPPDLAVEVLVVDDGGVDETPRVVAAAREHDDRVRLVTSPQNGGFIDACHHGASVAGGEVLLFLNNDTIPLPGWLEPVLRLLRDGDDVGAVGGKLLFPDGTLQEAGGVLYQDASGANFGKFDPAPDDALYAHVREVDYCSGAHLATPRELWTRLGGFDRRYTPAYYEDADYCFSVWAAGLRVLYQPDSLVVHLEGATAGRDGSTGMKRYQAVNRDKFAARWSRQLATRHVAPDHYTRRTWHQVSVRPPFPPALDAHAARVTS